MKLKIKYNKDGQTYTDTFTQDQAREELKRYGHPEAETLQDHEVLKELIKIFEI